MDDQTKKIRGIALWVIAFFVVILRVEVNGWGSIAWLLSIVVIQLIRMPFRAQTAENNVIEQRGGMVEKAVLISMIVCHRLVTFGHLIFGVFWFANYKISNTWTAIGVVINVAALFYFWRSHADLGGNWSVTLTVFDTQTLVTEGVYKRVRHPMYSSLFVLFASWPLLIHNWIASIAPLLAFIALYLVRVDSEEQMLQDRFGQEYVDYMSVTGRILPKLGSAQT